MTQTALTVPLAAPRPAAADPLAWRRLGRRGRALLRLWRHRARSRRQLARLDARLLRDVGLDPLTARREAALPFWRASETEMR